MMLPSMLTGVLGLDLAIICFGQEFLPSVYAKNRFVPGHIGEYCAGRP